MDKVKYLLKFGRKEHLYSFAEGGVYCSNAEVFWGIEDELMLKGQGDRLEASSIVFAQKMHIHDYDSHKLLGKFGNCNGLVRFEPAKRIPVFCLFAVYEKDCSVDDRGSTAICLSENTIETIRKHFPNADAVAVIQNPELFLHDVQESIGYEVKHEGIHYFNIAQGLLTNDGRRAMDYQYMMYLVQDIPPEIEEGKKKYTFSADFVYRALLCKDVFFKDEQEYRIVLPHESISGGRLYPVKLSQKPEVYDLNAFLSDMKTHSL